MKRVAVISGGCGDIGMAIADALAARGTRVALGDLAPAPPGCTHDARTVDVADEAAVEVWLDDVVARLGTSAIAVANAAIVRPAAATAASVSDWRATLDVNLTGAWLLCRGAAKRMRAAGIRGRIVLIGSWAAHAPHADLAAYSVAKAGLRMLGRCLALELAGDGITVNEVAPGYVDAGLSGRIFAADPARRESARAAVPVRALASAADIAAQVAHLCSPEAAHVTGSVLVIDGGLSLLQGNRS